MRCAAPVAIAFALLASACTSSVQSGGTQRQSPRAGASHAEPNPYPSSGPNAGGSAEPGDGGVQIDGDDPNANPQELDPSIPCVFALSPLPDQYRDGSRGDTYIGHGSSRDYQAEQGTPVHAMGDCTVEWSETTLGRSCGYGLGLRCRLNGQDMEVTYCHFVEPPVAKSSFKMGEVVGHSGTTGFSSGPHLHIGLAYANGRNVEGNNPDAWFQANGCYRDPANP